MKGSSGKFLGAALGYTLGGPIGALIGTAIGAAIGFAVDADATAEGQAAGAGAGLGAGGFTGSKKYPGYSKRSEREIVYIEKLILFLTGTARADGRVTPEKVETIRRFFRDQLGYSDPQLALIARLIDESLHVEVDLSAVCSAIVERTAYEERLYLAQLAYRVAVSDGVLTRREEAFIAQAARLLGVEAYDLAMIGGPFARFREGAAGGCEGAFGAGFTGPSDPYAVLGILPSSSDEEVQKAYRVLAGKYHPDKVLHLGQEFVDLANRKFTMIAKAYETIKVERRLG